MAQIQLQNIALLNGSVTDAHDIQLLGITLGNAHNHIVQQGSGQTVKSLGFLFLVGTGHMQYACLLCDGHERMQLLGQFPFGTLDRYKIFLTELYGNSGGNCNRHSTNS